MPKNVMKLLKSSHEHQQNDFDLSHRHLMTANFGELIPSTCIETVPGDYIEMRVSDLLRAIPMVTSPFMRVKQHFDCWFVPYNSLWSNFESFITQKYEPKHSGFNTGFKVAPYVNKYDLFSATNAANVYDVVGRSYSAGAHKLLNYLGYGRNDVSGSAANHPSVNLWRLAAYNKIWYEEYRQEYYDSGIRLMTASMFQDQVINPAVIFNFDDLTADSVSSANLQQSNVVDTNSLYFYARLREMTQMRYRCWKKDLFTGIMPSNQFGNVSTVDISNFRFSPFATSGEWNYLFIDGSSNLYAEGVTQGNSPVRGSSNVHPTSVSSNFDILALRKSEAIQIWRERALTAGNRVSDNLRSHYGDDVSYNEHRCTFLGSVDAPLNISDVNSTAQIGTGANQGLADVAGKGLSSMDDSVFKFKSKQFGVIMVMFSLLPEAEYNADGIDRLNQLIEPEDYFIPEYQDLGLEGVSSDNFYSTQLGISRVVGYAPRYFGYKQKLDKVFGTFQTGQPFAPWASPKYDVSAALGSPSASMPLSLLYVNPKIFDVNFAVSVDNSDQVICDFYFDVNAKRRMSISGLPNY